MRKYSLDVIGKFVFALELNSAKEVDHPFVKSIRKIVNFDDRLTSIIMGIVPPALFDLISKHYKLMDEDSLNYLANTIRYLVKQRKENRGQFNDFLDMHLNAIEEKNVDLPEDELIGNCLVGHFDSFLFVQNLNGSFLFSTSPQLFFFAGGLDSKRMKIIFSLA